MDIAFCCVQIRDTIAYVKRQRLGFNSFYKQFAQKCATLGLTDTDVIQNFTSTKDKRKQTTYTILDDIIAQPKSGFDHFSELCFLGFVDRSKFSEMAREFNDIKLQSLSKKILDFLTV